ncbi:ribBA [Symbiodinium pilosum]|uniref:RibBA protein n=1 Tax=Symbiodinium pilosum TaxID=2952 RepID=A0A812YHD8_SYMPI|nr:ribBA [Symbiodinium pilosum]
MTAEQAVTTLALRGISKTYTVRMVQYFLDAACGDFEFKRYNFLYLPRRGRSHSGLAIVNFVDAESCAMCEWRLRLLQRDGAISGFKSIGKSYIQGFAQNLAYYAALVREDARDASHVLVLEHGKPADVSKMIRQYVTRPLMQWAEQCLASMVLVHPREAE